MGFPGRNITMAGTLIAVVALINGCATRGYVRDRLQEETARIDTRLNGLDTQVATLQNSTEEATQRASLAANDAQIARQVALGKHGYQEVDRQVVYFDFDSEELRDDAHASLDQMTSRIRTEPDVLVDIYGYADPRGTERYNDQLGQRRAEAVLRYLLDQTPGQLRRFAAVSYGERMADASGAGERSEQRRAVVSLIRRVPIGEETPQAPVVSQKTN